MSKQEASDRIALLEKGGSAPLTPRLLPSESEEPAPFTEAHVCIVEGDQRSGKTTWAVKRIRQSYDRDCVRVFCEERLHIHVEPLSYSRKNRVAKLRYKGEVKYIRIPDDYKMHSPMRIFANIHLFAIPYVYIKSFEELLALLKSGFISKGWLLIDESHRGMSARGSMTSLGKEFMEEYFQFGKSQLDVIVVTHLSRLVDWTLRTVPTERVHTTYDKTTRRVTYTMRKKGSSDTAEYSFDATEYWPNFLTNEKVTR